MDQWESRKETRGSLVGLEMPQRCVQCVSTDTVAVQKKKKINKGL